MQSVTETVLYRRGRQYITLLVCLSVLVLSGCRVELYSQLSERQANEMLAVLIQSGVDTSKRAMGKGMFDILVDSNDLAESVRILEERGLPGDKFASMADLYKKEGLISSPMEERVRYMFALSQSIAETLTNIDGVLVARVHIALPESAKHIADLKPSSSSVFIKHNEYFAHSDKTPEIKRIVESSIEGLSYDRIAVFLSKSDSGISAKKGDSNVTYGPFSFASSSTSVIGFTLAVAATLIVGLTITILMLVRRLGSTKKQLSGFKFTQSAKKLVDMLRKENKHSINVKDSVDQTALRDLK